MQIVDLKFNHQLYKINLRDEVDQSVFNEIFKVEEYRCAKEIIKQAKASILDIGAHIGLFSLYCRALNKRVKIYSFEPEEKNFNFLNRNIQNNNLLNIETVRAAIADKTGEGCLKIMPDNHNHHLTVQSDKSTQLIKVQTLSSFCRQYKIDQISLLKMDIEGTEYSVINSWENDDFKIIRTIVLEYHDNRKQNHLQIEQKLRENGFRVQTFPSNFDKNMGFLWAINKK